MKNANEHPAVTFLKSLHQYCNGGLIHVLLIDRAGHPTNKFVSIENIDSIPSLLKAYALSGYNVYFGVATTSEGKLTKGDIIETPALWVEIDLTDKNGVELPNKKEILQRLNDFPLKPTFIINSGGGLHVYWKLKTTILKKDIPFAENLLKRSAFYFGGDQSSTDARHNLRLPGTFNVKPKYKTPRKVTIEEANPENEYSPDDFEAILPQGEEPYHSEERQYHQETSQRLNQIMECKFLKHCDEDRATLPEPEWYSMISNLARETGGPDLIHDLSRGYPKYSPKETDKKILHAINDTGPATCERIKRELFDCGKHCGVKSPASLAIKSSGPLAKNHEHHFSLIQAKDILSTEEPEMDWLWDGILPMGGMGLIIAKPKVGKTSLADRLAVAVSRGDNFLGRRTSKGTVVYLALEEKRGEIQKTLSKFNLGDENLFFHFGPAPREAMQEVEPLIRETKAKLLVIDILQKFCRVKDLNDYAQVTRALEPLMATARELNCHILLTHHAGKKDRPDGDDILGSTGLLGGVDTSVHIKRRDKESRIVFTIQRYGDDLPETVVTMRPDGGLEATGSREEVEVEETLPLILEALETGPLTEKEIGERLEKGHSLVSKSLRKLVEQGKIKRTGKGKRGDPYIYEKDSLLPSCPICVESRREMKNEDNPRESQGNISPNGWGENQECQERIRRELSTEEERKEDNKFNLHEGVI